MYKAVLKEPYYYGPGSTVLQYVLKIYKGHSDANYRVRENCINYNKLKRSRLPVPLFFEETELDGVIRAEDVNLVFETGASNVLYLSPNTARYYDSEVDKLNPIFEIIKQKGVFQVNDFGASLKTMLNQMETAGKKGLDFQKMFCLLVYLSILIKQCR